ncbi:transmembrane amino acid transporter [Diaporthe helianthi]|uniref:Transmembrane amino acid transporter n=1 Tax=Diaporthe helianthi TaxID=158607 RepID=A0A2P5IC85_DIAHE|nr:transmembrane amino acid transporter [Diaporthe helianthi]
MSSYRDIPEEVLNRLNSVSGSFNPRDEDQERVAAVVAEHLPDGYTAAFDGFDGTAAAGYTDSNAVPAGPGSVVPEEAVIDDSDHHVESSLLLQGGDIHRDLFKSTAQPAGIQRAMTFSHPVRTESPANELTAGDINQIQGFRRHHVLQKHSTQRPRGFQGGTSMPITRSFVEFLDLYGAFAGEDLADSDDEGVTDEEATPSEQAMGDEHEHGAANETSPLIRRRPQHVRRKSSRVLRRQGDAGTTKTFLTLLKAFVGTGIMFLPKAFYNGGILFSSICLISVAAVSMWAFHLLLKCRTFCGGSYGEIGEAIAGPWMRNVILTSITLSQLGFVCTGLVFVADNWFSFLAAVSDGANPLGIKALIALQALLLVPLSFIRNISKLGAAATLADAFILIGLCYIWQYDISHLVTNGMSPTVELFNPQAYTLTIGASIFTFEGIGLIIPIHASMRQPEKFEYLLGLVMLIITAIFTSVGALCYATFGDRTQIEVINNFPQSSRLVNAVQFLYALAVLIGNPVQLFPAMRILEGRLFGHRSGKKDLLTKWKKNAFRTALVVVCCAISIGGSTNLDRFVALIGSVACVPLVYVYPAFLHYKAVASTTGEKIGDMVLMVLGIVGMVYTTAITISSSFA